MDTTRDVAADATRTRRTSRRRGLATVATMVAAVGLLAAGVASAGDVVTVRDDGRKTLTVRVADLDGTREPGAEAMYARLQRAAVRVCGGNDRNLAVNRLARECREIAIRDAVASANLPKLSALHAAHTGERGIAAPGVNAVRDPD
jgi:UrcA family protein